MVKSKAAVVQKRQSLPRKSKETKYPTRFVISKYIEYLTKLAVVQQITSLSQMQFQMIFALNPKAVERRRNWKRQIMYIYW